MTRDAYAPVDELRDRLERIRIMLAAALQVRAALRGGGAARERFVRDNVEPGMVPWPDEVIATLAAIDREVRARVGDRASRFDRLVAVAALDPVEADLVLAAIAPGVRRGFREAMQLLGPEVAPGVHPAAHLIELIAGGAARDRRACDAIGDRGRLIAQGVLVADAQHGHAAPLWRALTPSLVARAWLHGEASPLTALELAPAIRRAIDPATQAALDRVAPGPIPRVILVGAPGSGRTRAAAALAAARGLGALRLPREPAAARPAALDARLRAALLVVELEGSLAAEVQGALAEPGLALAVIARPGDASIPMLIARGLVPVEVARAGTAVQVDAWHDALGARVERAPLAELVRGHGLELGQIERAAAQVTAEVAPAAATSTWLAAAERAARAVTSQRLAEIADRLSTSMSWDDLVLPDDVRTQIDDFWRAAAARRTVFEAWGFAAKAPYGRAISALFAGDPGTGKTMVATLVARELGLELYRVDLSRLVDKYVGETEKHLARLFEEAERGRCVILFDEADALFGKRSKGGESANDRYANLEINYLLQRIETFAGICILTTNQEAAMDDAFKRRLRYRIEFPFPEADERVEMWRRMIPAEAPRAPDLDVAALADRFAISGGHIKNAILRAAFAAAAAGRVIDQAGLVRAATQEMEHIGKVVRTT